eukprot:CAMPEP_0174847366 /NCGR_PEP_ID=MMETSP1114-20130205/12868_1 /TAXON_ID=312471 /ORGANISM="Neobodo designis, Strain CCAP 1951/1" /LENGTH=200 /DNA_ID=CAMNT_0016081639 /DNA_START=130 /DNA_END=728 /DNA_ORIENTATION=+
MPPKARAAKAAAIPSESPVAARRSGTAGNSQRPRARSFSSLQDATRAQDERDQPAEAGGESRGDRVLRISLAAGQSPPPASRVRSRFDRRPSAPDVPLPRGGPRERPRATTFVAPGSDPEGTPLAGSISIEVPCGIAMSADAATPDAGSFTPPAMNTGFGSFNLAGTPQNRTPGHVVNVIRSRRGSANPSLTSSPCDGGL